ncbi:unnamed protein product [Acanthoscelides obtectus]|nr:unnamed protein product [Acanthoscelides obtectus]CAK1620753.1 Piezo-type mechanosensitive ion channel component [Acanthoscelides obtectus]
MEEIYTSVYKVKCLRRIEQDYSSPPGLQKKAIYKYLYGVTLSLSIVGLIWFPILVFSWGRSAGPSKPPELSVLEYQIDDAVPIYRTNALIHKLNYADFESFKQVYNAYDVSKEFLYKYEHTDVTALTYRTGAQTWMIRPQQRRRTLRTIHSAHPVPVKMTCEVTLQDIDIKQKLSLHQKTSLFPHSRTREILARMIQGEPVDDQVQIRYFLPKFLKIEQAGKVQPIDLLMHREPTSSKAEIYRNVSFQAKLPTEGHSGIWWQVREDADDANYIEFLQKMPYGSITEDTLVIFSFTDRVVKDIFKTITGGSIITFYSVFLFVVHGWSRQIIFDRVAMVWLYEVPQADILYSMCKEVFMCREYHMWELEEIAVGRVFFMIRSGETTLKFSRFHGNPYNPNTTKTLPSITRRT